MYQKFVAEPKQEDAANELFVAQQNFRKRLMMRQEQKQILYLI